MKIDRVGRLLLAFLCLMTTAAPSCGPSASKLDEAALAIARSQSAEVDDVMIALRKFASTDDEMLDLAQSWRLSLPTRALPELPVISSTADNVERRFREAFRASVCSAIVDILRNRTVPSGQEFLDSYIESVVFDALPFGEIVGIVNEFNDLNNDAKSGNLTVTDIRLTLLEIQNC